MGGTSLAASLLTTLSSQYGMAGGRGPGRPSGWVRRVGRP